MQQSVEQGPTVVTEGGRGVRVDLKLVLGTLSLELQQGGVSFGEITTFKMRWNRKKNRTPGRNRNEIRKYYLQVLYWFRKLLNFYSF